MNNYQCGRIVYIPKRRFYTINCNGHKGNVVKIVQEHNYLQLAEVQVFGKDISRQLEPLGIQPNIINQIIY